MNKKALYYEDPYLREFEASVVSCEAAGDGTWLAELDRSAFYPEGGGQPSDMGELIVPGCGDIRVTDVREQPDGRILHSVSAYLEPGSPVTGRIDWERRFDHMQQHSGEHIVSGMICSAFGCDNVGFHMGSETVTIDYNAEITFDQLRSIEERANAYIWENHELVELWPQPGELEVMDFRSKKELMGEVRLTLFPGADCCACCGTHVRHSSEVGLVKFISCTRFSKGSRIELLCGKRAYDFLSMNYEQNSIIAKSMASGLGGTAGVYKKQKEELISEKLRYGALEQKYFELIAEGYCGAGNVLIFEDGLSPDSLRRLCVLIGSKCGGLCLAFSAAGDVGGSMNRHIKGQSRAGAAEGFASGVSARVTEYKYACIFRDRDISGFIRRMNAALSGHGGGKNGFAQGSVRASESAIREFYNISSEEMAEL